MKTAMGLVAVVLAAALLAIIWGCWAPNAVASGPSPQASTVTMTVVGPGWVVSSPAGITCHGWGTCTASFPVGTTVAFNAYPADAYELAWWSGGASGCADFQTYCEVYAKSGGVSAQAQFTEVNPG